MKVYRYMSMKEFEKMSAGCVLENMNTFKDCRTESEGFCFLPQITKFEVCDEWEGEVFTFEYTPEQCIQFLTGIVTNDVLVEFEVDKTLINASYGVYADPTYISGDDGIIEILEYCTKTYSRDDFIPCRYAFIIDNNNVTWYNFN